MSFFGTSKTNQRALNKNKSKLNNQFTRNHRNAEERIRLRMKQEYNASPEGIAEAEKKSQEKAIQYQKAKEYLQDQINFAFERPTKEGHFPYPPLFAIEHYAKQDLEYAPELVKMAREALVELPYKGRYVHTYDQKRGPFYNDTTVPYRPPSRTPYSGLSQAQYENNRYGGYRRKTRKSSNKKTRK